jgi:phage shock protein A
MKQTKQSLLFGKKGNVFGAIVVILFIITLLGMSGLLYWEKEKIAQQFVSEIKQAEQEQKVLKEELYKKDISLEKALQKLDDIEKQYTEIQSKYKELEKQYTSALDLRSYISQQFETFSSAHTEKWKNFEIVTDKFDRQLGQLSSVSNSLLQKVKQEPRKAIPKKSEKGVVDLPPVVVKDTSPTKAESSNPVSSEAPSIPATTILQDAQVMSVNHEHNFVVLNKGLVDGVRVGATYAITRGTKKIAEIRISEIRDFVSLGIIQQDTTSDIIKAGDKIEKST